VPSPCPKTVATQDGSSPAPKHPSRTPLHGLAGSSASRPLLPKVAPRPQKGTESVRKERGEIWDFSREKAESDRQDRLARDTQERLARHHPSGPHKHPPASKHHWQHRKDRDDPSYHGHYGLKERPRTKVVDTRGPFDDSQGRGKECERGSRRTLQPAAGTVEPRRQALLRQQLRATHGDGNVEDRTRLSRSADVLPGDPVSTQTGAKLNVAGVSSRPSKQSAATTRQEELAGRESARTRKEKTTLTRSGSSGSSAAKATHTSKRAAGLTTSHRKNGAASAEPATISTGGDVRAIAQATLTCAAGIYRGYMEEVRAAAQDRSEPFPPSRQPGVNRPPLSHPLPDHDNDSDDGSSQEGEGHSEEDRPVSVVLADWPAASARRIARWARGDPLVTHCRQPNTESVRRLVRPPRPQRHPLPRPAIARAASAWSAFPFPPLSGRPRPPRRQWMRRCASPPHRQPICPHQYRPSHRHRPSGRRLAAPSAIGCSSVALPLPAAHPQISSVRRAVRGRCRPVCVAL